MIDETKLLEWLEDQSKGCDESAERYFRNGRRDIGNEWLIASDAYRTVKQHIKDLRGQSD